MGFVFDFVLVAIIALIILVFAKRGFVKSIMGLISTVASFVIAWLYGGTLGQIFNAWFVGGAIKNYASRTITELAEKSGETFDLSKLFADMPDAFRALLDNSGVDTGALTNSYEGISEATAAQIDSISTSISTPIAETVSGILGFFALLVICLAGFALVTFLLGLIVKAPIIGGIDRLLGTALGLLAAFIVACILASLSPLLFSAVESLNPQMKNIFDSTVVIKFFYDISLFKF